MQSKRRLTKKKKKIVEGIQFHYTIFQKMQTYLQRQKADRWLAGTGVGQEGSQRIRSCLSMIGIFSTLIPVMVSQVRWSKRPSQLSPSVCLSPLPSTILSLTHCFHSSSASLVSLLILQRNRQIPNRGFSTGCSLCWNSFLPDLHVTKSPTFGKSYLKSPTPNTV